MPTIALSKEFRSEFHKLGKDLQKKTWAMLDKLAADPDSPGLNLEPYNAARDPRARTVRVDKAWRAIVANPEPNSYIVFGVKSHDEADRWMQNNRFSVNALTNSIEVLAEDAIDAVRGGPGGASAPSAAPATPADVADGPIAELAKRSDKEFRQVGITDAGMISTIRLLQEDEQVLALAGVLPEDQAQALTGLACGETVEEIYAQLLALEEAPVQEPEELSPVEDDDESLAGAIQAENTRAKFQVVEGSEELASALAGSFEAWKVFLHPQQRAVVERDYNGPARISGGAGTGKTVALLHRARRLAAGGDVEGAPPPRILVTTFTNPLTDELRTRLAEICSPDELERITLATVDGFARGVLSSVGKAPAIATQADEKAAVEYGFDAANLGEIGLTPTFLQQEWEDVVIGRQVTSRDEYFAVSRAGRGIRLDRVKRLRVWQAIEALENHLAMDGKLTFPQVAEAAAASLRSSGARPFDHVLIDESQDLNASQWRVLRAAVAEGPNDMFIAGDTHQRIYNNRVTLGSLGINIRGRSRRLRLNYRTTRQILTWSLRSLEDEEFDDLDGGIETLLGYRSATDGPEPVVRGYPSLDEEADGLSDAVLSWNAEDDVDWSEIAVCARRKATAEHLADALDARGVPTSGANGIYVGSMHAMKGLEFRCVAIADACVDQIPLASVLPNPSEDGVRYVQDLQRERCLLYVAATRAREQLRVSWSGEPSEFLS